MIEMMQAIAVNKTLDLRDDLKVKDSFDPIALNEFYLDHRARTISVFLRDLKSRLGKDSPVTSALYTDDFQDPKSKFLDLDQTKSDYILHLDLFDLFLPQKYRLLYLQEAYKLVGQHKVVPASLFLTEDVPEELNIAALRSSLRDSLKSIDYLTIYRSIIQKAEAINPMLLSTLWWHTLTWGGYSFVLLKLPLQSATYVSMVWALAQAIYWREMLNVLEDQSSNTQNPFAELSPVPVRGIMTLLRNKFPDMKLYQGVKSMNYLLDKELAQKVSSNFFSDTNIIKDLLKVLRTYATKASAGIDRYNAKISIQVDDQIKLPFIYGVSKYVHEMTDINALINKVKAQFKRGDS